MTRQLLKNPPNNSDASALAVPKTYAELRTAVRAEIRAGKERAFRAVEREKVGTAWRTGKIILSHILLHQKRGTYGATVLERLSSDVGISYTELRYMVEFARTYPKRPAPGVLSWSQFRELLGVNDDVQRAGLTARATKENWTLSKTRGEIGKLKIPRDTEKLPPALAAQPGKPGVYPIVDWEGKKAYDLGFSIYLEIKESVSGYSPPVAEDLFTYEAEVEEVIDGDTLWTKIHLGFGVWAHQKLRLRGIDAPEIISREGVRARDFVKARLAGTGKILIKTVKADKYDRYLTDVFYTSGSKQIYLNQLLIDKGHAVRVQG